MVLPYCLHCTNCTLLQFYYLHDIIGFIWDVINYECNEIEGTNRENDVENFHRWNKDFFFYRRWFVEQIFIHPKSPASPLFTQPFIRLQIKENIKAPRHWPLCGELNGEFPAQMASNADNVSIWWRHHVDVSGMTLNKLKPRQSECHFADDIFKGIFFNKMLEFRLKIPLKFVPNGPINNILPLV